MVASAHPLASDAGADILRQGGNAVDAAVATAFALCVLEPASSGLGGGGFMLIYQPSVSDRSEVNPEDEVVAIDYRERAPLKACRDMYKRDGKLVPGLSTRGHLAAGVPGTVAGLALALERYGTMSLAEVMAPAIRFAKEGFPADQLRLWGGSIALYELLNKDPDTAAIFLPHGLPLGPGQIVFQRDLARTLKAIAEQGPEVFYQGFIADALEAEMKEFGGLILKEDLAAYRPIIREPIKGYYRGYTIVTMPPPGSGAVVIEMLNILEGYDIKAMGFDSAQYVHLLAESMRRAFYDRSRYMGDPEFTDIPLDMLLSKEYAEKLRDTINLDSATRSLDLVDASSHGDEGHSTTHLSVVDANGCAVSLTQTINTAFGSGVVVKGTGILLNNEMDDFAADPGSPNTYGLVQGEANCIAPGKTPLSSMSPCLVFNDGKLFMVTGSPGGPRIITAIAQNILNVIDFGMNIYEANAAPRIHHQWLPDQVLLERARLQFFEKLKLKNMGHKIKGYWFPCNVQSIMVLPAGMLAGASDPRWEGKPAGVNYMEGQ
jgi:gamma-glutamyltranspeptidase/glutathione hydrolase